MHLALNQARVHVNTAYSKLQNTEELAGHLEVQLGIDKQWEIGSEHYVRFREEGLLLKYHSALDELKRLVIMHLFELAKLSLSGTGKIDCSAMCFRLQATSTDYEGPSMTFRHFPPRPKLAWKDIVKYNFLGEFDLLRHSHTDIRDTDWTAPAHHEATVKYFKLQRAREEIQCLDIEVRHLCTAIHDEKIKTNTTKEQLLVANPPLAVELRRRWQARAAINTIHLYQLNQLESQLGFSGRRGVGVQLAGLLLSLNDQPEVIVSSPNAGMCGLCCSTSLIDNL
ncbi:hypothetical protein DEU56DRAFT_748433 [Suillus clintonianus]|uniref:uncharacterized protein n=1 Tax=Suillus clintonianus TaxID=1904413 RepID=UPI001B871A2E|nr:uncharacterized protein DEU56DRAFT_748433 [Suillus clintonianus]KAG2116141.1 hypothetical protein DEU56DRAFT_748433 [Suillus clintonianus]